MPVSAETIAAVISWAIFGAGLKWSKNGQTTSAERLAAEVLALLTGGLNETLGLTERAPSRGAADEQLSKK